MDIPARPDELGAVHEALEHFWRTLASAIAVPPDSAWTLAFTIAALEIAGNIVEHAHPSNDVAGRMALQLRADEGGVVATFADRGLPFDPPLEEQSLLTEVDDSSLDALLDLAESGRGILITRSAVDDVHYQRTPSGVNTWRLSKRFAESETSL